MERHATQAVLTIFALMAAMFPAWQVHADASPPPATVEAEPALPASAPTKPALAKWLFTGMQATYVWQHKFDMPAQYTNPGVNSLSQEAETGYTLSATVFLGAQPWRNTEIFVNPEVIQTRNISNLHGLGGPSNGEAQKGGGPTPTLYLARVFVRQTIMLGGEPSLVDRGTNQFAATVSRRRLVITAGNLSVLDVFDPNSLTHDARTQFLNWALLTHGAFDYVADARGYTWGLAVEYYHDAWAFRAGRFIGPKQSNGLALDFNFFVHYGDNLEIEHAHNLRGRPGAIRLLGYRNHEHMGAFADAIDQAAASGGTPSFDGVRRDQSKYGLGISADQALSRDTSAFVRASWNDGRTETYSFTEIDRSLVIGGTMRGSWWRRPGDSFGAAWVLNGLSDRHRDYLARGGLGFFLGDGQLDYRPEQIVEVYYSATTFRGLWFTLDYQHVANPGYNADRGPADFFGVRLHLEL